MNNNPIGVFDSGIGGLTVVKEIIKSLPNESLIYLGDTARVPYGTRGKEVITSFSLELANFLIKQKVKFLVVACNTISATCLKDIQAISPVPVLGVIHPAVSKIIKATKNKSVGVIGTRATINSRIYESEIHKLDPTIKVTSLPCPLFVPIAEEGLASSQIAKLAAEEYLGKLKQTDIDTLHLGCTHYPLLKDVIAEVLGSNITIIDSAKPTAEKLKEVLIKKNLLRKSSAKPTYKFYVTDAPERVFETAELFLGKALDIEKVNISSVKP